MYILDQDKKRVHRDSAIERFIVAEKSDAVLVSAVLGSSGSLVSLGRYRSVKEAQDALYQLYCALASGESFEMPQSLKIEPVKHDARTRRRGGS